LTGYPFFPSTLVSLPVDWRVSASVAHAHRESIAAWARWPGRPPQQVLNSWHWLTGWWLKAQLTDRDLIAPLTLLASVIPALYARRRSQKTARTQTTAAMLAVVLPCLLSLIAWFIAAPDPRFAFAPIWLIPAALAAWALPEVKLRIPKTTEQLVKLLPHVAVMASMLGTTAFVAGQGAFLPIVGNGPGPLGTDPLPKAKTTVFRTDSGLILQTPEGTDQCWAAYLCTPVPDTTLKLRGVTIADGFKVGR
jgi:hypothetical protein